MNKTPTLGEAGLAWIRGLVEREGVLHGLGAATKSFYELAVDYLPSRRRLRYGDIDYDFEYRVNTTWARPSLSVRLREIFTRGKYQPSEPQIFHEILDRLGIEHERFTFIDLGSGKGRTLLMASDYPFRKIVGAEIVPELHAIAETNVAAYRSEQQKCFQIETWLGDAREYVFPAGPLVVYLFNPFPEDILQEVLERLRASFVQQRREIVVAYHNLVHEGVMRALPFLEELGRTEQFAIYRVRETAGPMSD